MRKMDLANDSVVKLFFKFTIPSIISMLVITLYNVVDGIFITRGVGSEGIAAVNIGYPILNLTVALSLMFGIGGATLIAFKKNDIDYQNKCFSHMILLNLIVYVVIMIVVFSFSDSLLLALGANEKLLPMVKGYLYPCAGAAFFLMLSSSLNAIVRNDNAPKRAMISTLMGAFTNVILDYIFIFIFNMGIQGGAYATAISQIVSTIYLMLHFKGSTFKLILSFKIIDFNLLKSLLLIGFPSFILEFAAAVVTVLLNKAFMNAGGIFGTAAYSIVAYSFMIFRMLFAGIGQGPQPILSYNYGTKNFKRVKEIFVFTQKFSFVVASIFLGLVYVFSGNVIELFTSDPKLLEECSRGYFLYSIALCFLSYNFVNIGYLQAVNKPIVSNMISVSRSIVFVVVGLIFLPRIIGMDGLWLTLPFADFITAMITIPFTKKLIPKEI